MDRNSTGDVVSAAQAILAHKGYQVTVNGTFDEATKSAVRQVQILHGLPATTVVDVDTWCALVGGIVRAEFRGL